MEYSREKKKGRTVVGRGKKGLFSDCWNTLVVKMKGRTVVGRGEKNLLSEPGSR